MNWRDMTAADIDAHNAKVARDAQAARERQKPGEFVEILESFGADARMADARSNPRPVRKLNEERSVNPPESIGNGSKTDSKPKKASKPRRATEMNRTEAEYGQMLKAQFPGAVIHWEAYVLRLANRCTYCPDFSVFHDGKLSFWEVKGSFVFPKALVKPRIAAVMFPHHKFTLAQKTKQGWKISEFSNGMTLEESFGDGSKR